MRTPDSIRTKAGQSSIVIGQPKRPSMYRQFILAALVLGIAGCSVFDEEAPEIPQGRIGHIQGNIGGVVADEPRAALVGRDILSSGGSAADAAVATFFTMSVTLPSSVSLGGGGVCLVRDHNSNTIETLDFRAMAPGSQGNNPDTAAIPGSPRAFALLHARYGSLQWAELLRPAENLARFGTEVSRALGQDLKVATPVISQNRELWNTFAEPGAAVPAREGTFLKQVPLSAMLARIRSQGASVLYNGQFAREFAEAAGSTGPSFTYEELRDYIPQWRETVQVPFLRNTVFHFPAPPGTAGVTAAQMTSMVLADNRYQEFTPLERAHLLIEATERSLADRARWRKGGIKLDQLASRTTAEQLLESFDETRRTVTRAESSAPTDSLAKSRGASFVVVDRNGSAVTCSFTMNKAFGVRRMVPGTGIVLAARSTEPDGEDALASVILASRDRNALFYASAASGGSPAPSALVNVMASGVANPDSSLEEALAAKRVHHGGADQVSYLEKSIDPAIVNGLGSMGHKMAYVRILGYVNAVFCSTGIPHKLGVNCEVKTDPRGFGLGVGSD